MQQHTVAMIGTGFAADIHAAQLRRLVGINARVTAIAGRNRQRAQTFMQKHDLDAAAYFADAEECITRSDAEIVDLVVPTCLHVPLALAAIKAGKQVICEKPLTGYFGPADTPIAQRSGVGDADRATMLEACLDDCRRLQDCANRHNAIFCYAENWVYAPPIAKARRLLKTSGGVILEIRCGESHSGSHSPYARQWRYTGGGSLLRNGAHPFGAALHLKCQEGLRLRGAPVRPQSVIAVTARCRDLLDNLPREQDQVVSRPDDVEDWSSSIVTFEDGTNAVISANDITLGGIDNWLNIYASNTRIECRISHNDSVRAFGPTGAEIRGADSVEKIETTAGWNPTQPDEDWMTGYPHEMQDFLEAIHDKRPPLSDLDLAVWCVKTMYCAYVSAQTGRQVTIPRDDHDR
jgi:predicted dehydrogenase